VVAAPFLVPYPPSWFDRLTHWIDQLPGSFVWPYLVVCLALLVLAAALLALEGETLSVGTLFAHSVPFYGFWLLHHLDHRAAVSLEEYRSAFTGDETALYDVRCRMTTLPARPALLVTLIAAALGVGISIPWGFGAYFSLLDRLQFYASMAFAGLYIYHSIRQLRLVRQLYATRTRVDLHNVSPLYAFSTLSAHTAIGGLLIISGAVLITPEGLVGPFLPAAALFSLMAVLAFLLPLMGLHRRLANAKDEELGEISRRWQLCIGEVYRRIDDGDLAAADHVNTTLSALERARTVVERVPTWPWRPDTLRGVMAALVLPVFLRLVQVGLERLLG
jgi:hypothetical protein